MDVAVVAAFEDFDETLDKRLRGPGSGRKQATQALVHHLCQQPEDVVRKVDLLILDWKSPPKHAAKEIKVSLCCGASGKQAHWGSREQLATTFPASVWDVAISAQTRRFLLDFTGQLKAKRHVAMAHDYNLPCDRGARSRRRSSSESTLPSARGTSCCARLSTSPTSSRSGARAGSGPAAVMPPTTATSTPPRACTVHGKSSTPT